METKLKKIVVKLLSLLGVEAQKVTVKKDESGSTVIDLAVDEKEAGVLIGYHGEAIAALQLILGMMLYRQTGEWHKLVVNIGDYRQKRSDYLTALAEETAAKVIESGESLALYHLNPFERRIIHMALGENDRVATESQGEGRNRFLVISPK